MFMDICSWVQVCASTSKEPDFGVVPQESYNMNF